MSVNFANNNSLSAITALPASISGGSLNLISTQTASSSSAVSFTSGLDSTYKEYIFKFINCHPSANSYFAFNMSADGGSNYNVTKTSNHFYGLHYENDGTTQLDVDGGRDLAQGTGIQHLSAYCGTGNDEGISGFLYLFDPSNTTFVKHYIARTSGVTSNPAAMDNFTSGYGNTTSAVNAVQFSFSSGNIDSGTIKLYGVS
jgi:hypothetical protein